MKTTFSVILLLFIFGISDMQANFNPIMNPNLRYDFTTKFDYKLGANSLSDNFSVMRRRRGGGDLKLGAQTGVMMAGGFPAITLGINGEFPTSDKLGVIAKFHISLPYTEDFTVTAIDLANMNNPSKDIACKEKITFFYLTAGSKYNFVGGGRRDVFSFYAFGEAGLLFARDNMVMTEDVPSGYYCTFEEGAESFANFTIGGGLGIDLDLDFGNLFMDFFLALPANQVNGQAVAVQIGGAAGLHAGIKVPLG